MIKTTLLFWLPLSALAFSVTNLPAFVGVESVQPLSGNNLTFTVDSYGPGTNGSCTIVATFNTEPTQTPRMIFTICGPSVNLTLEPVATTYPTNSNTGDYFTYSFICNQPTLPPLTRLWVRKQGYFGGPVGSPYGLDCAGIAHIDWANNLIWLPIESDTFRFGGALGADYILNVKGGHFQRPAMSAMSAETPEGL